MLISFLVFYDAIVNFFLSPKDWLVQSENSMNYSQEVGMHTHDGRRLISSFLTRQNSSLQDTLRYQMIK